MHSTTALAFAVIDAGGPLRNRARLHLLAFFSARHVDGLDLDVEASHQGPVVDGLDAAVERLQQEGLVDIGCRPTFGGNLKRHYSLTPAGQRERGSVRAEHDSITTAADAAIREYGDIPLSNLIEMAKEEFRGSVA